MPFADILGQEKAVSYLKGLAAGGKIPGAMLFFGEEGIGKAKTALEFAKALNVPSARARTPMWCLPIFCTKPAWK